MSEEPETAAEDDSVAVLGEALANRIETVLREFIDETGADILVIHGAVSSALLNLLAGSMIAGGNVAGMPWEAVFGQAVTGLSMSFCMKVALMEGDEEEATLQ